MKRNKHSLSHYKLLSCDMGFLVPCMTPLEVLPGDSIQQASHMLVRLSPLQAPVMHPIRVKVHHWFVPHRLVWDNGKDDSWEAFITGGHDGLDASVFPTITVDGTIGANGSLSGYLGMPDHGGTNFAVSALPFRGYALIYNEWYRDQDINTELAIDTTGGVDTTTNTSLARAAWEKDYFTAARPWTQKGTEVSIPLAGTAPVYGDGKTLTLSDGTTTHGLGTDSNGLAPYTGLVDQDVGTAPSGTSAQGEGFNVITTGNSHLNADLSNSTGASIIDVRLSYALQRYKEARAKYGSRYSEYLRYLGVRSSDARLQRPEYLGGGRQTISVSEVLATAETGTSVNVGDLKGHGIGAMRTNRYRRFFEEHGYIYSMMHVQPKTMYYQGTPKSFIKSTKEDFWQQELEHVGQSEIQNREIYQQHATPAGIFGYQDRYDEYRRAVSSVAGEFRTSTLDFWHMARKFSSDPALNATFTNSNPTQRIHAVTTNDVLWVMASHSIQARRLVSKVARNHVF
jgi:hypothetical protein